MSQIDTCKWHTCDTCKWTTSHSLVYHFGQTCPYINWYFINFTLDVHHCPSLSLYKYGCYTFSSALSSSLRLLQWREQAIQEVEEALQHTTVTQGSLANAGQEHEYPGIKRNGIIICSTYDMSIILCEFSMALLLGMITCGNSLASGTCPGGRWGVVQSCRAPAVHWIGTGPTSARLRRAVPTAGQHEDGSLAFH